MYKINQSSIHQTNAQTNKHIKENNQMSQSATWKYIKIFITLNIESNWVYNALHKMLNDMPVYIIYIKSIYKIITVYCCTLCAGLHTSNYNMPQKLPNRVSDLNLNQDS